MIGIPVHLDVVPEGSGWTFPPYGGKFMMEKSIVVGHQMTRDQQWQLYLL